MPGAMPILNRTSTLMHSQSVLTRLQETQQRIFEAQTQLSTGKAINRPSDAPEKLASVQYLSRRLEEREQEQRNLNASLNVLETADQRLDEAHTMLMEAHTIASSQIGVGSNAETRAAEAQVVDAQIRAMLDLANAQFAELSVFGGNNGAASDGRVFESFMGGIRYSGGVTNLAAHVGASSPEAFTSNGLDAFGALSSRVRTSVDLDPAATGETRLADLEGALGKGVRGGAISVNVNGNAASVDLTHVDTLGDVADLVNDAINTLSPGDGTLTVNGGAFELTTGGASIALDDMGAGKTAADLGIAGLSSTGPAAAGLDVHATLIAMTPLADLGASPDLSNGLSITQGEQTVMVDFSGATTVQDLQNTIENLDLGLRLEINDAGSGLDLVSEVAGIELSVGENGGSTAGDLGIRSFGLSTPLSAFRHGRGVESKEGVEDFTISLHEGTSFGVDLGDAATVGEIITAMESAAAAAGLTPAQFDVGLASTGNGLAFTDNTTGTNDLVIANANQSLAGNHLGITGNAGAATAHLGEDNATVRVENAFTHLMNLRDALRGNDEFGITLAGEKLSDDLDVVVGARAVVGVQAERMEDIRTRSQDQTVQEKIMLSDLQDADLAQVITRYQQLQLQLRATLQVTAQSGQLSLMDFLR